MTSATRALIFQMVQAGRLPPGGVVPPVLMAGGDWPAWAIEVLVDTEESNEQRTDVVYRGCGRCLEPIGMSALVYGHRCANDGSHLPAWARQVLWAVA